MPIHYINCPGGALPPMGGKEAFPTHLEFGRTVLGKGLCQICHNYYAMGTKGRIRKHDRHIVIPDRPTAREINEALITLVSKVQHRIEELDKARLSINYPSLWHSFQEEFQALPQRLMKEYDATVAKLVAEASLPPGSTGATPGDSP